MATWAWRWGRDFSISSSSSSSSILLTQAEEERAEEHEGARCDTSREQQGAEAGAEDKLFRGGGLEGERGGGE